MTETVVTAPEPASEGRVAVSNATANAVGQLIGKLTTFVWIVVAARMLTRDEFGGFNLALSIALLATVVAEWGFDVMLVRRASAEPERASRLLGLAVACQSAVAVPLFLVIGVVEYVARRHGGSWPVFVLVLTAIYVELWNDSTRAAAAAVHKQGRVVGALVLQRLATAGLIVGGLAAGWGLTGLAVMFFAGSVIGWVTHQLALWRIGLRVDLRRLRVAELWDYAAGTTVFGLNAIVLIALARVDAVLLSALKGDAALGSYSTAYRLFDTTLFLTFAVSSSVLPLMSGTAAAEQVRRLFVDSVNTVLVAYLPFAVICLVDAPGVLNLFFDSRYQHTAAGALRWLAFSPVAFAFAYLGVVGLTAMRRTRALLVASIAATVVNVAVNVTLIPAYSGTGAGAANTIAYGVQAVIVVGVLVAHVGRLPVADLALEPAVAAIALSGLLLAVRLPAPAEIAIGVVVYAAVWLALVRWRRPDRLRFLRSMFSRGGNEAAVS